MAEHYHTYTETLEKKKKIQICKYTEYIKSFITRIKKMLVQCIIHKTEKIYMY